MMNEGQKVIFKVETAFSVSAEAATVAGGPLRKTKVVASQIISMSIVCAGLDEQLRCGKAEGNEPSSGCS